MARTLPASSWLKSLFILTIFASLPTVASAATVTFGPASLGAYTAGFGSTFLIPQFNPALGTLTQVDLSITGQSNGGSNGVENTNGLSGGNATLSIGTDITVTGPAALVVLTTPATVGSALLTAFDGTIDFSGASGLTIVGALSSDSDSASITSGLAPYIGLGVVSFGFTSGANTSSTLEFAPSVGTTGAPTFSFITNVVYTYTPVPEPASIALCGIGLAFLGVVAARRGR